MGKLLDIAVDLLVKNIDMVFGPRAKVYNVDDKILHICNNKCEGCKENGGLHITLHIEDYPTIKKIFPKGYDIIIVRGTMDDAMAEMEKVMDYAVGEAPSPEFSKSDVDLLKQFKISLEAE